ncbi:hypothetical protein [Adhaeribacter rhizoryzae]|uniref:Uncharacterized protein n=1 Tax=Adhaeribacter rhizoryzae TaxID=2607907 RepID=A0A5M6CW20_9BACT|nr:hypothetical protein [Adhaeribacter rhizoryzae]KAA5539273.1 hypothetical protein F0145_24875 [Adhaeribacter rhizoryzae]
MLHAIYSCLSGETRRCLKIMSLILLLGVTVVPQVWAQEADRIRVKVGDKIESHEFASAAYRYPVFKDAVINYTTGGLAQGKLNYHQILSEMHFIGPKGDTLALDNLYLVKFVAIGDTKFYYDPERKGFGEEIADFKTVKLLIKHKFKPSDKERGVAYGQYSNASATKTYSTYAVNGQIQQLSPNEYLVYAKMANYFITDQNNQFYLANKASVVKIFSKQKTAIGNFIKENRIDFQKEDDLKKLLTFCTQ